MSKDFYPDAPGSRRYATWAAVIFLIVTLIIILLDLAAAYHQGENEARTQASNSSALLDERLSYGIKERGLILQSIGETPLVQRFLEHGIDSPKQRDAIQTLLKAKLADTPFIKQVELLDSSCQSIFSSSQTQHNRQYRADFCRWFHRNDKNDMSFISTQYNPTLKGIMYVQKIAGADGNMAGMIIGVIANDFFQSEIAKLNNVGTHGEILVTDQSQHVIGWKSPAGKPKTVDNSIQPIKTFERDHDESMLFIGPSIVDKVIRLYSIRSTQEYPFQIAIGIAEEDFSQNFHNKMLMSLLAWLFMVLIIIMALRSHLANIRQNQLILKSAIKIQESEEQARQLLNASPIAILLVSLDNQRILQANSHACHLLHIPESIADGKVDHEFNLPLILAPINQWLTEQRHEHQTEVELTRDDGSSFWAIISMEAISFHQRPAYLVSMYDISTRKSLEEELELKNQQLSEMAITDPLTRLTNRRHADQVLKDEVSRCARYGHALSIAIFDIDHFKQFNDRYGHQAGDNVLIAVANVMKDSTRTTDICARIGGEEFLVIFPYTRLKDAQTVMERVRICMAETQFPFAERRVTFSGGLTEWQPADTPSSMLSRADKLLYSAKQSGRNRILVDASGH